MSKLYLVATPIGNMADITLRALDTLKMVDVIACEDTRHTLGLLNYYDIKKPLISYYKQKENVGTEKIISLLNEGKNVALVTDAGMPCISDPGSVLVRKLKSEGYEYTIVPGANAVVSAVALSGVEGGFCFAGFLSDNKKTRREVLEKYSKIPTNVIFFSAPHDLNSTLEEIYKVFGERKVHLVKEITKLYENVYSGDLSTLRLDIPRGEFVVIIEKGEEEVVEITDELIYNTLLDYIANGMDKKEAIAEVVSQYKISKNKVYKIAINL